MDHIYFMAKSKSPAGEVLQSYLDSCDRHIKATNQLLKDLGITDVNLIGRHHNVCGIAPKDPYEWLVWLDAHPLWRRVDPRGGSAYAVPRRTTRDAKALSKRWTERPRPFSIENIGAALTGVPPMWFHGMTLYMLGFKKLANDGFVVGIPHFVVDDAKWAPAKGLTRPKNQDKLRALINKDP